MANETDPMRSMMAALANTTEAERRERAARLMSWRQTGLIPLDEDTWIEVPRPYTFGAYVDAYERACWSIFVMYWPALAFYALIGRE